MNNILLLNVENANEKSIQIALRVKARRLELNLTQGGCAIFPLLVIFPCRHATR